MSNDPKGLVEPLKRGDVYEVNLDPTVGAEIRKKRPALIIQNDVGNKFSPVTIVAPISSEKEITKPLPVMVFLQRGEGGLKINSYVDCGQIRTLDKYKRLINKQGSLKSERMSEVCEALKISLGLRIE